MSVRTVWQKVRGIVWTVLAVAVLEGVWAVRDFERAFAADYAKERAANAAARDQEQKVWVYLTTPIDTKGTTRAGVIDAAIAQGVKAAK